VLSVLSINPPVLWSRIFEDSVWSLSHPSLLSVKLNLVSFYKIVVSALRVSARVLTCVRALWAVSLHCDVSSPFQFVTDIVTTPQSLLVFH